jgi:hypothetical protein
LSSSKTIDLQRDFATSVNLSEAQNPIPNPPPLTHCIRLYSILTVFSQGRGEGGGSSTREKWRGATVPKAGSKIPT